jgi:hypothetical protein
MIHPRKILFSSLFAIIVFSIFIHHVKSTAESFNVSPGEEVIRILKLNIEDHVSIKFTVIGTIQFDIVNPDQEKIMESTDSYFGYSFICDQAGNYILRFYNMDSSKDKMVTLNYEIQHYIFGIPQMLFLTIIIVIVCIGAVATFTLMGRQH